MCQIGALNCHQKYMHIGKSWIYQADISCSDESVNQRVKATYLEVFKQATVLHNLAILRLFQGYLNLDIFWEILSFFQSKFLAQNDR